MQSDLNALVTAFELSQRESLVFETLLGKGYQPASRLARLVALPRNTTRNILDRLVDIGLASRVRKVRSNYYRVERVADVERAIRERLLGMRGKLKQQLDALRHLRPFMEHEHQSPKKPTVTVYEGLDGAQRVYDDTLTSNEVIRAWASFDANAEALPEYFHTYYRRRAKRRISIRSIHPDTPLAQTHMSRNRQERREGVLVPPTLLSICPEVQVYGDKINLVSWPEKLGILIESRALADALKQIFDLCFSLAQARFPKQARRQQTRKSF